jgi:hypothetical protein
MPDTQLNIADAKVNPSKYFQQPQDVLVHPGLTREAKIDILRAWEVDARLLQTAEEENMTAGEHSHLGAIVSALLALEDETKGPQAESPAAPTKLGNAVH